jgi:hypothetical protein
MGGVGIQSDDFVVFLESLLPHVSNTSGLPGAGVYGTEERVMHALIHTCNCSGFWDVGIRWCVLRLRA